MYAVNIVERQEDVIDTGFTVDGLMQCCRLILVLSF